MDPKCMEQLKDIREDVNELYQTVYRGNGTPSLITQINKLEHRIDTLNQKLDSGFTSIDKEIDLKFKNITDVVNERFNLISYQITEEFAKKRSDSSNKWTFKTSTITAAIAGFCSILSVVVAKFIASVT